MNVGKLQLDIETNPLARFFKKHRVFFLKHKDKLWWFHSTYALFFGIGVMWLGKKNFNYIRLAIVQIVFIWLTSLAIPSIITHPRLSPAWRQRIRLLINYFNRNLYQQMLFFVIPIYYMSTTLDSQNIIFILLIAVSAVFSTMDIVYDRYISVKAPVMSLFFAFNLFVCINVMLPFLWNVKNAHALRISGLFAFLGFATFCFRLAGLEKHKKLFLSAAVGLFIFIVAEFGSPFIPPAPLRTAAMRFGTGILKETLRLSEIIHSLPEDEGKIYVMSVIKAPLGHREKVRHTWYLDGEKIYISPLYEITGLGGPGYRFWTYFTLKKIKPDSVLRIDLTTANGQLAGRARLRATAPPTNI